MSKPQQSVDCAVQTDLPPSPSPSHHLSKPNPRINPPQHTSPLPTLPPSQTEEEGGGGGVTTGKVAPDTGSSLSTLASFFSGNSLQKSLDAEILQVQYMYNVCTMYEQFSTWADLYTYMYTCILVWMYIHVHVHVHTQSHHTHTHTHIFCQP